MNITYINLLLQGNHQIILLYWEDHVHMSTPRGAMDIWFLLQINKSNTAFLLYCWLHSLLLKEIYLYVVSWPTLLNGFYWGHFQQEVLSLSSSVSCSSLKYFCRKKFSQFLSTLQVFDQRMLTWLFCCMDNLKLHSCVIMENSIMLGNI